MERKAKRVFGECYEPDLTHKYNFMFDTSAINGLAEKPRDIEILIAANEKLGYEYFRCRIQDDEIVGLKSDGTFHKKFSKEDAKSKQMRTIIDKLSIQKIPCLAKFVEKGIALSDINYLKDSSGKLFDVFEKVFAGKVENLEDAIIVEAAMRYNCIVVCNDRKMSVAANSKFPSQTMWYPKFIEKTEAELNSLG